MPYSVYTDKSLNHLSRDEQFLRKVKETVEFKLSDEQFGVIDLAEAMAMSRTHLYRKLKKLMGKSISQYIREIRLEKAMKMLQEDVASISEIAYLVGFNSPAYFNKCFHDYYGNPPGKVLKNETHKKEQLLAKKNANTEHHYPINLFNTYKNIKSSNIGSKIKYNHIITGSLLILISIQILELILIVRIV